MRYNVVEVVSVENDEQTHVKKSGFKSKRKAIEFADELQDFFYNKPFNHPCERQDGLAEQHSWKVVDEKNNCVYEIW